jgi:ribonuclease HI
MEKNILKIYTDGSSTVYKQNNIRYGGIGVYFPDYPDNNISISYSGKSVTNQRMELNACINGIEKCIDINNKFEIHIDNKCEIHIYTDSMYVINCITKWAKGWEKLEWKRSKNGRITDDICNLDLIKKLYGYYKLHTIKFTHVRSHQKKPDKEKENEHYTNWYGNNFADKLATDAMIKIKNL